jgi:hypothetical protein
MSQEGKKREIVYRKPEADPSEERATGRSGKSLRANKEDLCLLREALAAQVVVNKRRLDHVTKGGESVRRRSTVVRLGAGHSRCTKASRIAARCCEMARDCRSLSRRSNVGCDSRARWMRRVSSVEMSLRLPETGRCTVLNVCKGPQVAQ